MNTPNKLTLLRIILVPVIMLFLLWDGLPHNFLIAGLIFGVAAITDMLDGQIARKRGLVTNLGKLMDPVADKLLVCSTLICFVQLGLCDSWIVVIVLAREFLVTSVRLVAAGSGKIVAANGWGKAKTISQIVALVMVFVTQYFLDLVHGSVIPAGKVTDFLSPSLLSIFCGVLLWGSALLTLVSGALYMWENRGLFKE